MSPCLPTTEREIEQEALPLLEPATEAQEGAAVANAEAADVVFVSSSSEETEIIDLDFSDSSSEQTAAVEVRQEVAHSTPGALIIGRAICSSGLLEPVLQFPPPSQPVHLSWTYFIVWEVPGRPEWAGVHFSFGDLCSEQIRLHAAAALPHLSSADACWRIRWARAYRCTQAQLKAAFRQGAGLPVEAPVHFYWWRY